MTPETLRHFAGAWIRQQVEQLEKPLDTPDSLHDRRVASRRLRVAWAVFREDRGVRPLAKALKAVTRGLGPAREWDVQAARLALMRDAAEAPVEQAALEWLQERARKQRKKAWRMLRKNEDLPKSLIRSLERFAQRVEAGEGTSAPTSLLAKRALQPLLQKAYGPLGDLYGHDLPEEMHRVRRAFKRFRYALEILELAFREVPQDLLSQARKVQDLLGAHHDQVVLQAFLMGERERLEKRSRSALVVGLNLLFTRSEKEREGLFETFRREGPHLSVRAVSGILSRALTDLFP